MFPKNLDTQGRLIRTAFGIALLALAWWQQSWILLLFALFTFFEAWMSWCIVYHILGKNSCPK